MSVVRNRHFVIPFKSHVRRLAAEHNCPMPTIDIAHQNMLTARALHQKHSLFGEEKWKTLDWSASIAGSRVAAGLEPFDSNVSVVTIVIKY